MTIDHDTITDARGRAMFYCAICREPLTKSDFFDLALRLPDYGESVGDYCDAELIDRFEHVHCTARAREAHAS
jgi:hypothetical protein